MDCSHVSETVIKACIWIPFSLLKHVEEKKTFEISVCEIKIMCVSLDDLGTTVTIA